MLNPVAGCGLTGCGGLSRYWRICLGARRRTHRSAGSPSCRRGGACKQPALSAELPETGERFEGLLPPVVTAPAFAIRKPAVAVFALDDYVAKGS